MANNKTCGVDLQKYLNSQLDEKIIALPLEFEYLPVEIISKEFTKLNSPHPYRIHYLGPRFTNTLLMHKKYSGSSPANQNSKENHFFEEILRYQKYEIQLRKIVQSNYLNQKLQDNHYYKSAIFYRAFEGMNPTLNRDSEIIFNSCFESANLDCAIKVSPVQFDLFLRIDSNTRGHTQWFYFSVSNGSKTGNLTFNICNLTKPKTLYEQGMRPYVFSKKKFEKSGRKWQQDGSNVDLSEKRLRYSLIEEMIDSPCVYKLSFDYNFEEEDDQVYFAYSIPYTYSQMLNDISQLPEEYARKEILGRSLTGVQIPILHISNHSQIFENNQDNRQPKKNVLITGRIHPGQSNGSHVLKGFIEFLCGNSKEAHELRNRMNFFIVPMVNPDGVIMGNSRSSASGKDLNREYLGTKKQLYPEVHLVKNLAYRLQRNEQLMMFFDFHGHSRKKNTFFYGPGYSLSEPEYYKSRALAKIIEKINNSFRYYSCSFMISEGKKRTARAVLFDQIKIPYVFTIQSSIGLYYDCVKLKTMEFSEEDWNSMGANISQGLCEFIVAYEEFEELIRERRLERKKRKEKVSQIKKGKKFLDEDPECEETVVVQEKKSKSFLMLDLMEEIKQQPISKNNGNLEAEASSDDHDDAENLESSKLAEFNNLIIYSKQKDMMNSPSKLNKVVEDLDESIMKPKKVETQTDEIQLFKEMTEQTKKNHPKNPTKLPQGPSFTAITQSNNPSEKQLTRKNTVYGSKSMKLTQDANNPRVIRDQCRQRKSVNFETHRHLISKQFFPLEKCQIVDLPKSSLGNRKEIKKGRVMIEDYINDKMKEKELKEREKEKEREKIKEREKERQKQRGQNLSQKNCRRKVLSTPRGEDSIKFKKFQIEDLQRNRIKSNSHMRHNKFLDRKMLSMSNTAHIGYRSGGSLTGSEKPGNMRIFDTVLFSGLQGMEIDNMAMMIKTFNR